MTFYRGPLLPMRRVVTLQPKLGWVPMTRWSAVAEATLHFSLCVMDKKRCFRCRSISTLHPSPLHLNHHFLLIIHADLPSLLCQIPVEGRAIRLSLKSALGEWCFRNPFIPISFSSMLHTAPYCALSILQPSPLLHLAKVHKSCKC